MILLFFTDNQYTYLVISNISQGVKNKWQMLFHSIRLTNFSKVSTTKEERMKTKTKSRKNE